MSLTTLKRIIYLVLALVSLFLSYQIGRDRPEYYPKLMIVGDVSRIVTLDNPDCMGKLQCFFYDQKQYKGIPLSGVIEKAKLYSHKGNLCFRSVDGFSSLIDLECIDDSYILFSAENGWQVINVGFPPSSNAKDLKEIIVINSDAKLFQRSLCVLNDQEKEISFSPGILLQQGLVDAPYYEGSSQLGNGDELRKNSVFSMHQIFTLSDLMPISPAALSMVFSESGQCYNANTESTYTVNGNRIDLLDEANRFSLESIRGIIINPPRKSVKDVSDDVMHYLENNEKFLLIVVCGFSFADYIDAQKRPDYLPLISYQPATGVFPYDHEKSFCALLTGEDVLAEEGMKKENQISNLPERMKQIGKKLDIISYKKLPLNAEAGQVIAGIDGKGDNDDIFSAAMAKRYTNSDLLIVCLDGKKMKESSTFNSEINKYIRAIREESNRKIMVASTQPEMDKKNRYGYMFSRENMLVIYGLPCSY